jgi:DNA-binding Lrp family transcriptional regulator
MVEVVVAIAGAEACRQAVKAMPEVISCHLVSREADFLLQVWCRISPGMSVCCWKRF